MKLKLLTDSALLAGKTLVASDLHIGVEYEIFQKGISIPSQMPQLRKRLDSLIEENNVKKLVFAGDLKHGIPLPSLQEKKELPEFLEHFTKKVEVHIVKGNHDGGIETLVPKEAKIYDSRGCLSDKVGIVHGNSWPNPKLLKAEYVVIGHDHPAIEFKDKLGYRYIEHCWIKCGVNKDLMEKKYGKPCNIKEAVLMPAFNHLLGGMAFNKKDFEPLGPLFKKEFVKWKSGEVYLLDGTSLGTLENLTIE